MLRQPCTAGCERSRHAKIRRLLRAIATLEAAAAALAAQEDGGGIDGWPLARLDLEGMLWAMRVARSSLESGAPRCCLICRQNQDGTAS